MIQDLILVNANIARRTKDNNFTATNSFGDSQNYTQFSTSGDMTFAGTAGMICGVMFVTQATIDVTIGAADTWYEVTTGLSDGGMNNNITFQNSHELKILHAGRYLVTFHVSMSGGVAGDEIMATVGVNGTADGNAAGEVTVVTGNKKLSTGGQIILDLAVNDVVSVFVQNEDAARDINIEHLTMSVLMVAG